MPATTKKVTDAIIDDIEEAKRFNFTNVPDLHQKRQKKGGLIGNMLQRYYIETCLYAVEKWELHLTNVVSIAVFFFIAKSLYTLFTIVAEAIQA